VANKATQVAIPSKESLPPELTGCPQWLPWRYGPPKDDGRRDKIPCDERGLPCDCNDPNNWHTFEDATSLCEKLGADGIGLAQPARANLVALDLDNCRDPVTGKLTEVAQSLVEFFRSYSEITPSQKGIRIWLGARYPERPYRRVGHYRGLKIEVFKCTGFVTVTGDILDGYPLEVADRESELSALEAEIFPPDVPPVCPATYGGGRLLPDEQLIERVCLVPTGNRLWTGNKSDFLVAEGSEPDDSAADFALLMLLRRWTQDAGQLERVFSLSKLGEREKWRERADYRQRSIAKALATTPCFEFDQLGDKDRFIEQHGSRLLFVEGLDYGSWTGSRWVFSEHDDQWARGAELTARRLLGEAAQAGDALKKSALNYARRIQTRHSLLGIVHQAKTDPRVRAEARELDRDPYAINLENKMVNLKEEK